MTSAKRLAGVTLTAAIALAFTAAGANQPNPSSGIAYHVKCAGINSCRGQSACRLTTNQCRLLNECKGKNSCKGKGWVLKTPQDCKNAGGSAPEDPNALK